MIAMREAGVCTLGLYFVRISKIERDAEICSISNSVKLFFKLDVICHCLMFRFLFDTTSTT